MTGRDRMALIGIVVLVVLGGTWMLGVSPKRKQAGSLATQVTEAQTQLASAQGQLANAQAAQAQYAAAYSSIVSLGKAVPASQEVPSLIYQLSLASRQKNVNFSSIVASGGSSSGAAAASTVAAATPTSFSQLPFTFTFNGGFFALEHLFQQLNGFTVRETSGGLRVSGRLLTMQSVKLVPVSASTGGSPGGQELSGTITATAYVLPPGQGLTGSATSTSPTGATTRAASTTGAASSPTPPAIARVTP